MKALPTLFLMASVLVARWSRQAWFLLIGLGFQLAGDMVIDLDRSGNIIPAMGLVCLAFVFYNLTFLQDMGGLSALGPTRRLLFAGIVLFTIAMAVVMALFLPTLMLPAVLTYVLLLTGMGLTSLLANYRTLAVTAGTVLYMITDASIGINEWVTPIPGAHFYFWPLYFAGQILIVQGLTKEKIGKWFFEK